MPQFQVPQFIETEDKIVGPLTLKQFGYVGAAAFVIFLLYFVLTPLLWLLVAGIFVAAAIGLAFGKVNGRPMMSFIVAFIDNIWKPKIYVFRPAAESEKEEAPVVIVATKETPRTIIPKRPMFGGIKDLRNWIATSKTAIPKREKPLPRDFGRPQKEFKDRYEVIRKMTGEREVAKRVDFR